MRLLWLLPDLGYTSAARQTALVAPELVRLGHDVTVAALQAGGVFGRLLREANIPVRELATRHDLPVRSIVELEKLLRESPFQLVHAWRRPALRSFGALRMARSQRPKLVASQPDRGGRFAVLDRFLMPNADRVAPDDAPLAVGAITPTRWPKRLAVPDGARVIVCLGEFTKDHFFRDAIWAFDALKFVYADLHLVLIGDGPERDRLFQFAGALGGPTSRAHFLTDRDSGPDLLANATVVWIPSRKPGGEQIAVEAQAAGVPVVATDFPVMSRLLARGEAGRLVTVGDPVALAKATRPLLDDAAQRSQLVDAARRLTPGQTPAEVATYWQSLYAAVAG